MICSLFPQHIDIKGTKMKLFTELVEDVKYITEANEKTGKKDMYIEGIFLQAELQNRNGRMQIGRAHV